MHAPIISLLASFQCAYNFTSPNHDSISSRPVKYDVNSCLVFVTSEMTFDKAEGVCQENNGHLVDMDCSIESFIQDIFNRQIISRRSAYWIGLRKHDDKWKWVNGETTYHRDIHSSSMLSFSSKDCIKMHTSPIKWFKEKCDNELPFICILKNQTNSVAFHNETGPLTTEITPTFNVTTENKVEPDPCVCNATIMGASDNETGISNPGNDTETMEHKALQSTLEDLMTKVIVLLVVLVISLLTNVIIVIICLFQQRSKFKCPHCCFRNVQWHKDEEIEMAPLQQSPQINHSVSSVPVHDPKESCSSSENELYSCVEDRKEAPEKLGSANEINIYSTPEENENIYEDQHCRRVSEAVLRSNSIYGQSSSQDLYEECKIDTDKDRQFFENDRRIDSKITEDPDGYANRNCEDFKECMSDSSKTTLHHNALSSPYNNLSELKMTNMELVSSSDGNVYGIESGTDLTDFPDIPKNKVSNPCLTYLDFQTTQPNTTATADEDVYGMESATYIPDDSKLQSSQLQEVTGVCDIYSNLKSVQSETVANVDENLYGIDSASNFLAAFAENEQSDLSNKLPPHENDFVIKPVIIITNDGSTDNSQNNQTGKSNFNTSLNTGFEESIPINKNRKHYVNIEPNGGRIAPTEITSIKYTSDDLQTPNQNGNLAENRDYCEADVSEPECDTPPPFLQSEIELKKPDDSTLPLQNTKTEGVKILTGEFVQPSPTNNVPKSNDGYVTMGETVYDQPVSAQRSSATLPVNELGLSFEIGGERQTEKDSDPQYGSFVENIEKQRESDYILQEIDTDDRVQPEDDYGLPLDNNRLSQSKNDHTLALGTNGASQVQDDYELPMKSKGGGGHILQEIDTDDRVQSEDDYAHSLDTNRLSKTENDHTLPLSTNCVSQIQDDYGLPMESKDDVDEDDYSTPTKNAYVNISSSSHPLHTTEKSKESCPETISSHQIAPEPENLYSRLHGYQLDALDDPKQNIYGLDSASCLSTPITHPMVGHDLSEPNDGYSN